MAKNLVIVESPAKARTIKKFLGNDYQVEASIGHIRDLPAKADDVPEKYKKEKWSRLGVDTEHDFKPLYIIPDTKKKQVTKLKQAIKDAKEIFLATDEDREGESISWHLLEVLKPKVKPKRLVFHEITKDAIEKALKHPRDIDENLVHAQETRRILDRLYGYEVSPVLWRKVAPRLSAGRVQSVAIKLVVERERQRAKFVSAKYFDLIADFETLKKEKFQAELKAIDGKKIASGKDFDPNTGKLKDSKKILLDEKSASKLADDIVKNDFSVSKIEKKPYKRNPEAPFTTSTLQQEAARKLRFSAKRTMQAAQKLYENGYITYMRTDSTTLAESAIKEARQLVEKLYGKEFLPSSSKQYKSKVKNAQEAHEAIRPAGKTFRLPEKLSGELLSDELAIYELIWKRTIASQMKEAQMESTTAEISDGKNTFQANGKIIVFPGFLKAYVQGSDDPDEELEDKEKILPPLKKADQVNLKNVNAKDHHTKPIGRYTEASLIKELEAKGIGRPSTYAAIMDTIQRREYVFKKNQTLVPTFVAYAVVDLMNKYFTHLVDYEFTAEMEEDLDEIAGGSKKSVPYLKEFYFGTKKHDGLTKLVVQPIDAKEICTIPLNKNINIRIGKFGPYLEVGDGEKRAALPDETAPADLDEKKALEIIELENTESEIAKDKSTGQPIFKKVGRYGPYLQRGEKGEDGFKMKSIPKFIDPDEISKEQAQKILSLPFDLGESIMLDIGPYGPYLKSEGKNYSVPDEYDALNLNLKEAKKIIAEGPKKGGAKRQASAPLKEFKNGLVLKTGRYGPYVSDGKINASLPKNLSPESITENQAKELIEKKKN
ncbi:type I DNA topoisomerase [Candidatus Peregrinibacteria bacterium]|nr:type I DNA topoisomerase [Candidatus Peregrinibacteria bacterium]